MSYQRECEQKMLFNLWVRAHEGSAPISLANFKAFLQSKYNISDVRFDEAISNFKRWGYLAEVDLDENAEVVFRLSGKGIDWVEDWFLIERSDNGGFDFYRRYKGTLMLDMSRNAYEKKYLSPTQRDPDQSTFWTKWGAIAASVAIPVALFTWWFS